MKTDVSLDKVMSEVKFLNDYSRFRDDLNRYETWEEAVDRVMSMHKTYFTSKNIDVSKYLDYVSPLYKEKRVVGSQRALQFGGEQMLKKHSKLYNCTFTHVDRLRAIGEFAWFGLSGCGVGISVQKQHVAKLPVCKERTKETISHTIEDSIEGWADAYQALMDSFFDDEQAKFKKYSGHPIRFDFSKIRPKGAFISGGFKAPGHVPLQTALTNIEMLLTNAIKDGERKLKPIELFDICMYMADSVISGGIRRCLPAGTKVHTKNGLVNIENIEVGTDVLTSKGYHKVRNLFVQGKQDTIFINTQDGKFECTPNHKMAVWNTHDGEYKWVKAGELKAGDRLITTRTAIDGVETSLPATEFTDITIPELDTAMAWLIGAVNARDCGFGIRNDSIFFDFFYRENIIRTDDKIIKQLQRFVSYENFFTTQSEYDIEIGINSPSLVKYFSEHILRSSDKCVVPDYIMNAKPEIRMSYLAGLFDAIGSDKDEIATISASLNPEFAKSLQNLCYSCGMETSLDYIDKYATDVLVISNHSRKLLSSTPELVNKLTITKDCAYYSLPAGTKVHTKNGLVNIENRYGDRLITTRTAIDGVETSLPATEFTDITIPELDTDMAWLIGVIHAQGSSNSEITNKVEKQLQRFIRKDAVITNQFIGSVDSNLSDYIKCNILLSDDECVVPDYIMNAKLEIRISYLAGLFDVIGSDKDESVTISASLHPKFVKSLQNLCYSCGIETSFDYIDKDVIRLVEMVGSDSSINIETYWENNPQYKKDYIPVKVLGIEAGRNVETFDIEVDEVHEFFANGYLTHNSATITLFSKDDQEMLTAKSGNWFSTNPQRGRSNNSVAIVRSEITFDEFNKFFEQIKENGEPGFVFVDDPDFGTNPCQPADATVLTPNGISTIGAIKIGDTIWSKEGWTKVINKWSTGIKDVHEYHTNAGTFVSTENHRIVSNGTKIEVANAKSIDVCSYVNTRPDDFNAQSMSDGVNLLKGDLTSSCLNDYFKGNVYLTTSLLRGVFKDSVELIDNQFELKVMTKEICVQIIALLSEIGINSHYSITDNDEYIVIVDGFSQFILSLGLNQFIVSSEIISSNYRSTEEVFEITVDNESHTYWSCGGFDTSNCGEIGLYPKTEDGRTGFGVCNLTEINGKALETAQDFYDACRAASILGTLQAAYTDFDYPTKETKEIVEREALLGVSITGWMNSPDLLFDEELLKRGAEIVKETNAEVAKHIGINAGARLNAVKPSGNVSCILGSSSGCHGEHSPIYLRRMQVQNDSEILKKVKEANPNMVEPSAFNNTSSIIAFPIISKKGSIFKKDLLNLKLLEKVKFIQKHWVENGTNEHLCVKKTMRHNVSNTITVDNWEGIAEYVFENRDSFCGISFMPDIGEYSYVQLPFTEVYSEQELIEKYGSGAMFASGVIVRACDIFGSLWTACSSAKFGLSDDKENHDTVVKNDWIRQFKKFSKNYFNGDDDLCERCLKDVFTLHMYSKIVSSYKEMDLNLVDKKEYTDVGSLMGVACAGGACDLVL